MTKRELYERIKLAWDCPNCIWELDRKGGYCWEEEGEIYATPGVAVMACGLDSVSTERSIRAWELHLEWSYLMHMEQAINFLFAGNTHGFNNCVTSAGELALCVKPLFFKFNSIEQLWTILK